MEGKLEMKYRIYWGLAILTTLIIGISVIMLTQTTNTEPTIVYKDTEPSKENPPASEPGYKWVWHNNHWDKVKTEQIAANPTEINQTQETVSIQDLKLADDIELDIPISDITADVVGTQEYHHLVKEYIDYHLSIHPECKNNDALLKDAQHNASWTLSQRKYDRIIKLLDFQSDQIDNELALIYGGVDDDSYTGDVTHFYDELSKMSDNEKIILVAKLQSMKEKSSNLNNKMDLLYQHTITYQEPSHTH